MILTAYTAAVVMFVPLLIQEPEGPQPSVPELKALSNYAGSWDSEFRVESPDSSQEPETFRGQVEGKWSVGGRYLEQTGIYQLDPSSSPMVIKTMMTFNMDDQKYRYVLFVSTGDHHESTGKWDPDKKIMTSIMKEEDGGTMITIADFSQPGVENWTIEMKNASGETTSRIIGKNTRKSN